MMVTTIQVSEGALRQMRLARLREQLAPIEALLTGDQCVLDLALQRDPTLALLLLDLVEANAHVLNRLALVLDHPRDSIRVAAIIEGMRASARGSRQ
jgi:hypothetical protein